MENHEDEKMEMVNKVLHQNEGNEKMLTVEDAIKEKHALADARTYDEETSSDDIVDDSYEEDDEEEENDGDFDWGMEDVTAAGILTLVGVGVAVAIKKTIDFFMDEDNTEKKEKKE